MPNDSPDHENNEHKLKSGRWLLFDFISRIPKSDLQHRKEKNLLIIENKDIKTDYDEMLIDFFDYFIEQKTNI